MSRSAENIIRLAMKMQGTAEGVTLDEITAEFRTSRKTAERLRDDVGVLYPQIDFHVGEHNQRSWYIPPGTMNASIAFTAGECLELDLAIRAAELKGLYDSADELKSLRAKVSALMTAKARRAVESDLELLSAAEGFASLPVVAPRKGVLQIIRTAILRNRSLLISLSTNSEDGFAGACEFTVQPLAVVHGNTPCLLGRDMEDDMLVVVELREIAMIKEGEVSVKDESQAEQIRNIAWSC